MSHPYWIEAVPNLSSANPDFIKQLIGLFQDKTNVHLLHLDSSAAIGRTVCTIVGQSHYVFASVHELFALCQQHIDIFTYESVHPHIGALDVCPFVPLYDRDRSQLDHDIRTFAHQISDHYSIPIFFYADLASTIKRKSLHYYRKGGPKTLCDRLRTQQIVPDHGSYICHPTLGSTAMGLRDFMIAYNINLPDATLHQAREAAAILRKQNSGLKAMGWFNEEFSCTQLSMNLYDQDLTMPLIYARTKDIASEMDIEIGGSELIGLTTLRALGIQEKISGANDPRITDAIGSLALSSIKSFDPTIHILDLQLVKLLGISINN